MNPYHELMISKDASLKNLVDHIKNFGQLSEEEISKILESLQKKGENEQKEILLNKLVRIKYDYLVEKNSNNFLEKKETLKRAYEMISTPEKRKSYEERKQNAQNIMPSGDYTKGALSKSDLLKIREENKKKNDPNNIYPDYTGDLYSWNVELNVNENSIIFMDEKDEKNENIRVIKFGNFYCEENSAPNSKMKTVSFANIIGIVRKNSEGQVIKSEIMLARLDEADRTINREFLKNIFLSDGLIEQAKLENNGYMGKISEGIDRQNYVEYNFANDAKLVSALELAKYTPGIVSLKKGMQEMQASVGNFEELKGELLKLQERTSSKNIQNKEEFKEPKRDGDEKE